MLKYILLFFFAFFLFGCSHNGVNDSSDAKFMSISRAPNVDNMNITQVLVVEFSSEIDPTSLFTQTKDANLSLSLVSVDTDQYAIYLRDSNGTITPVNITQDSTTPNKIIVTPWRYFTPDMTYTLVVTTALKDVYGKSLSENYELSFTPVSDGGSSNSFNVVDANPYAGPLYLIDIDVKSDISFAFDGKVAYSDPKKPWFIVKDLNTSTDLNGSYEYINKKVVFTPYAPLTRGHTYDVNFTANSKTDMYGNELNISSAVDRNFTVNTDTSTSYVISGQGVINIGYEGEMVRYFTNIFDSANLSAMVQYAAVARSGGVDFYTIDINTTDVNASTLTKQPSLTLELNSTVTDMKYVNVNNNQKLLISTLGDGVFVVGTTNNSDLNITRLLENEKDIYGVGFGLDVDGLLQGIYAVGPTLGLRTFKVDTNGSISSDKNISIKGDPLKVVGGSDGTNNYIFVADYKNGVQVYNSNGDFNTTVSIPGNVKSIEYPDTYNPQIIAINSIGNIYNVDPSDLSKSYFALSTFGATQDLSIGSSISVATSNKGVVLVDPYFSITEIFADDVNENIVSSFSGNFTDGAQVNIFYNIVLSKEGKLMVYFQNSGQI